MARGRHAGWLFEVAWTQTATVKKTMMCVDLISNTSRYDRAIAIPEINRNAKLTTIKMLTIPSIRSYLKYKWKWIAFVNQIGLFPRFLSSVYFEAAGRVEITVIVPAFALVRNIVPVEFTSISVPTIEPDKPIPGGSSHFIDKFAIIWKLLYAVIAWIGYEHIPLRKLDGHASWIR